MSKKSCKLKEKTSTSVQAAVKRLRKAAAAMDASRSRYAAYTFLLEVYRIYWTWLDQRCAGKQMKRLNRRLGLHRHKNQRPFKTLIIAANCSLEAKLRSRWIRALEYALSEETESDELIDLFRTCGGVAGCARFAAKPDPRRYYPRDDWGFDHAPFDLEFADKEIPTTGTAAAGKMRMTTGCS